ncbi:hypothetical protein BFT35_05320 [Thermoanaerobacterium thermosaccharolyticum]|uniref:IPT/TIG domain-containing protein n=1 Tax=Thermoanaerobacterium thermosaccharolyticum TaxID=1517 RepID=UPI000C07EF7D|nr:IPT/TIG domain-containing protein [Thermoanaerobacterium thermosaccharolyticum]PHO07498.1 hypothetical protein BFT35_05320 [Thermoanaerobacterium thermosaccharolyticum]
MRRYLSLLLIFVILVSLFPGNMSKAFASSPPNITAVKSLRYDGTMASPAKGPYNSTTDIEIDGSAFMTFDSTGNMILQVDAVYIDSISDSTKLTIVSVNESKIYAKVPKTSVTGLTTNKPYMIIAHRSDGQSAAIPNGFTYLDNPDIKSAALDNYKTVIRDSSGNVTGITQPQSYIRMEGSNLSDIALGNINGETSNVVSQSGSVLISDIPSSLRIDTNTTYNIYVTNIYGGQSDTSFRTKLSAVNQDITSLSKYQVIVGDTITIYGHGFSTLGSSMRVYVGENLVSSSDVTVISDTEMTVKVPAPKDTTLPYQNIDIVSSDGSTVTLVNALKIIPTPSAITVDSITPNAGTVSGGTKVIIVGQNLRQDLVVKFGGVQGQNVQMVSLPGLTDNMDAIQVTTPPYSKSGPVNVDIVDPITGYTVTKENGYFYLAVEDSLVAIDMNPYSGYENGSTDVTIWGYNFQKKDDPSTYTANPDSTEITYVNSNYTYTDPVTGQNATGKRERKLYVTFGGNKAKIESVSVPSGGQEILKVLSPSITLNPPGQSMPVDVVVTVETTIVDSNGNVVMQYSEQSSPPKKFTYNPLPSNPEILSISPNSGSRAGGDTVTIQGFDIRPGASIYFGGALATVKDLTIDSSNRSIVTVITPKSSVLGYVDVKVVNKDADQNRGFTTMTNGYYYYTAPTITSVFTNFGSKYGGNLITITGMDFYVGQTVQNGVYVPSYPTVTIGNINLEVISVQDNSGNIIDGKKLNIGTQIKAMVPVTSNPYPVGWQDITITNYDGQNGTEGGTVTLKNGFEIKDTQKTPTITSVTPNKGPTKGGTQITITGSNFESGSIVTIDGVQAKVTSVTSGNTVINAVTPAGTLGKKIVQVINPSDGGTASLTDGFEYLLIETKPKITSISPDYGGKGTLVYIFGSDFSRKIGDSDGATVYIGNTVMDDVYVIDENTITAVVPDLQYSGLYDITVVNPDTATAKSTQKFHYLIPESNPVITAVTPDKGTVNGGTAITITGSDFRRGAEVYIGGKLATNITVSSDGSTIQAMTPPGNPGRTYVTVINYDGGNYTYGLHDGEDGFTYVVPNSIPVITKINPNTGSTYGGDTVTIIGQDFRIAKDQNGNILKDSDGNPIGPDVYFGNVKATKVIYVDYGTLKVVTPPNLPGSVRVSVVNYDTGIGYIDNGFTYIQSKPVINSIVPPKVNVNGTTHVIVLGSNFAVPIYEGGTLVRPGSKVYIDDVEVTNVTVVSSSEIKFVAPLSSDIGKKTLKIVNPDGGTAMSDIEYVSPVSNPVITSVDPSKGSIDGGTTVTITGSDFRSNVEVYFEGNKATIVSNTDTEIVVKTPSGDPSLLNVPIDVTVYNVDDGASAVLQGAFTYVKTGANPVITSITPNTGSTRGGDTVTIVGDNFKSGLVVYFGDAIAPSVTVNNYKTITVITPQHAAGKVDVRILNPDYADVVLSGGFTYIQTVPDNPSGFYANTIYGNDHTIHLYWNAVNGAKLYEIYGKRSTDSNYSFIASTDKLEYYVDGLSPNTLYNFELRPINDKGNSGFAYASAYTDSSSNSKYDTGVPDVLGNTVINPSGDTVYVTLGNDAINSSSTYTVDLTGYEYRNANVWVINVPKGYSGKNSKISLRTPNFSMDFTSQALNLTSDIDRITVKLLNGKTIDTLNKNLGKSGNIVSDVYQISYDEINGSSISHMSNFRQAVNIEMNYYSNRVGKNGTLSIKNFDGSSTYYQYVDSVLHYASAYVLYTGRYAVINSNL